MAVTYEKTFEIEIINELSASVYNRVLNYVLNHESPRLSKRTKRCPPGGRTAVCLTFGSRLAE